MSDSIRRVSDGTAWREFCRNLEQAGEAIFNDRTPADGFNRAEGLRYLTRPGGGLGTDGLGVDGFVGFTGSPAESM